MALQTSLQGANYRAHIRRILQVPYHSFGENFPERQLEDKRLAAKMLNLLSFKISEAANIDICYHPITLRLF